MVNAEEDTGASAQAARPNTVDPNGASPVAGSIAYCTAAKMDFQPGRNSGILRFRDTGKKAI